MKGVVGVGGDLVLVLEKKLCRKHHLIVTCSHEMRHMSKKSKIELVTPLERIFINLSNGVTIMDISLTQPKLLDVEHA